MVIVETLTKSETNGTKKYRYFYRLTKKSLVQNIQGYRVDNGCFGVEVERQDFEDGTVVNIEREAIPNISPYRHKARYLLKLLYDNAVSPIHLIDVAGEYVDAYISDFNETNKEQEDILAR